MTFDQIRGPVERLIYIGLGWFVARGFITSEEVANYATLALGVIAAFYGWWQNRPKAIMQSAAAVPGTVVLTTPALSQGATENILSTKTSRAGIADAVKTATTKP